jgi:hypothetical protein
LKTIRIRYISEITRENGYKVQLLMTFVQQLVLFGHVQRIDEENCLTTSQDKMERRRTVEECGL